MKSAVKKKILDEFKLFSLDNGKNTADGIGGWISEHTDERVFERLAEIETKPLSKVQLNQLLAFGHEAPVSDSFFDYYWLTANKEHPYNVSELPFYESTWEDKNEIQSLKHLKWGFYRLFVDGLLYFGNVRTAYRKLRSMEKPEILDFFASKKFNTQLIKNRGPALELLQIPKDDRYLISEMACKSYGDRSETPGELEEALLKAYEILSSQEDKKIQVRDLIAYIHNGSLGTELATRQLEFNFSADEFLEERIDSLDQVKKSIAKVSKRYFKARSNALKNTDYYLSMVNDLDVYVATSMRNRDDFRNMASDTERIFSAPKLKELELRYFDPTLSAAAGHEDKGLIECLMVKCAKVLVYCAGDKESWGKDAEAAMALSLGKPVIFYCKREGSSRFYREVHPLIRLIEFKTGVAVGAMVADSIDQVSDLLYNIFENKMEYELEHDETRKGYLRIKEKLTNSTVRLQTGNRMLSETFWNQYHNITT